MLDKDISIEVAKVCREFRVNTLKLSLTKFSEEVGLNLKNVNAFEYGRANSIHYVTAYLKLATATQREELCEAIFNIL